MLVAPSILSADFSILGKEVNKVESAGANWLHLDVMDGLFVPNITFGMPIIKSLRSKSDLFFDVHLMIQNPSLFIDEFVNAGADLITLHWESFVNQVQKKVNFDKLTSLIDKIHSSKRIKFIKNKYFGFKKNSKFVRVGMAINPNTDLKESDTILLSILSKIDLILVMSVNPGFGGQKFIPKVLEKVDFLEKLRKNDPTKYKFLIEMDGGINNSTIPIVKEHSVDVVVAGSYIFKNKDYSSAIDSLKI